MTRNQLPSWNIGKREKKCGERAKVVAVSSRGYQDLHTNDGPRRSRLGGGLGGFAHGTTICL